MSGSRARSARRRAGHVAVGAPEVDVMPGACLDIPEQIEAMKRQTHDGVIAAAGARRLSGVSWTIRRGQQDCQAAFDAGWADCPDRTAVDAFRVFFETNPDRCVLVLAAVDVRPRASKIAGPA